MLLFFVEILDLVQIEQHPLGRKKGVQLIHNGFDIAEGSGGGIEPVELPVGLTGDDAGQSGFSHAGGAVEDHIGNVPIFNEAAKNTVGADQMALAHHIVQGLGAQTVCQRFVHVSPVPPRSGRRRNSGGAMICRMLHNKKIISCFPVSRNGEGENKDRNRQNSLFLFTFI